MPDNTINSDVRELANKAGITIDAAEAHAAFVDSRIAAAIQDLRQQVQGTVGAQRAVVSQVKDSPALSSDPEVVDAAKRSAKAVREAAEATNNLTDKTEADEDISPEEVAAVKVKADAADEAVEAAERSVEERLAAVERDVATLKGDVSHLFDVSSAQHQRLNDLAQAKSDQQTKHSTVPSLPKRKEKVDDTENEETGFTLNLLKIAATGFVLGLVIWWILGFVWSLPTGGYLLAGVIGAALTGVAFYFFRSREEEPSRREREDDETVPMNDLMSTQKLPDDTRPLVGAGRTDR